jgi:SAM-dependent methyltransferase
LDISAAAIEKAKARLGEQAQQVTWLEADITQVSLPNHRYDVWHDRAVFHFLTQAEDRRKYISALHGSLKPNGYVIIATFAPDGPLRCSGLDVVRYSPNELHTEFGDEFHLVDSFSEEHPTPFVTTQMFSYCLCQRRCSPAVPYS